MSFIKQKPVPGKSSSPSKKRERIPQGVRFDVFRRDNFACVYCGAQSPAAVLECDHKVAVANGGSDAIDNLVTACFDCNRGKGVKVTDHDPAPVKVSSRDPLVGMYGHSWREERINWQFRITGATGEFHSLQLYSWLDGRATEIKLVRTVDLSGEEYTLYSSEDEWLFVAERETKRQRAEGLRDRAHGIKVVGGQS